MRPSAPRSTSASTRPSFTTLARRCRSSSAAARSPPPTSTRRSWRQSQTATRRWCRRPTSPWRRRIGSIPADMDDVEAEAVVEEPELEPELDPAEEAERERRRERERREHHAMAMRLVRQYPDPALRVPATVIADVDDDVRSLVERMADIMRRSHGVGLAAPQIGVLQRVFVYRAGADDPVRALINPELSARSDEMDVDTEGCLS